MVKINLTSKAVSSLELQTEQAFAAFKHAVSTKRWMDAAWAYHLYSGLHDTLSAVTNYSPYMDWNRGTPQTDSLDRYVLQRAIGFASSMRLQQLTTGSRDTFARDLVDQVSFEEIIELIQSKKGTYAQLVSLASALVESGKPAKCVTLIEHVRQSYSPPKV